MKNRNGFSLVELSLIVTIISIIVTGYVYVGSASLNNKSFKNDQTYKKMMEIDEAIKLFFSKYNRLPCPAKPTIPVGSISTETYDSASYNFSYDSEYMANTSHTPNGIGAECLSGSNYNILGAVPTKTLNLPSSYILDSWGNKITYRLNPTICGNKTISNYNNGSNMCNSSSYNQSVQFGNSSNHLDIFNGSTTYSAGIYYPTSNIAYALISAGANSYNTYTSAGVATANSPNSYESYNNSAFLNNSSGSVINLDYQLQGTQQGFDDIILFATKDQIDASRYLVSNPSISLAYCLQNTGWMNAMTNGTPSNLSDLRNNLTVVNQGDSAILDMMWILQETCYALYGAAQITKKCPISGIYNIDNTCSY